MRHAVQAGIAYFDTAPHYGNGLSERRFGAALRDVPRDRYVLSTKVGRLLEPDAAAPRDQHGYVEVPPVVQRYDYSRAGVLRSLAESRARLELERIDVVYVHDLDRATHGRDFERALPGPAGQRTPGARGTEVRRGHRCVRHRRQRRGREPRDAARTPTST